MSKGKRSAQQRTQKRRSSARESPDPAVHPSPGRDPAAPESRSLAPIVGALLVLTAAVYFPVASHDFVLLDDPTYFTNNPNLDGALSFADIRRAFVEPYFANWIPLTHLSIGLDDALHGATPGAVLATNVAIHGLAGLLLFLALVEMTGRIGCSAFVASIFLVHPLHVESVAWASSRKDTLVALFWMATLLAYSRYCASPSGARYAGVVFGCACALLSKPTAVTLPFVLCLLDVWPLRRIGARRVWLEKLPLLALAAGASLVTLLVQRGAGAEQTQHVALSYRLANAVHAYAAYVVDSFWPTGLAAFYPYPTDLGGGEVAASCLLLLAITAVATAYVRRHPALLVGWLWFLGTLVPAIGIVQVGLQARADRYMYLPLVGLAIAVAWGGLALLERGRGPRRVAIGVASGLVLILAVAAHAQVRRWHDTLTLFSHASAVTDDNYFAHQLMGNSLRGEGKLVDAERELREAVRIKPDSTDARIDLAATLVDAGLLTQARAELDRVKSSGRESASLHLVMGLVAEKRGRTAEAIAEYGAALELQPGQREAANNLSWLLATSVDPAQRDPERAIELARGVLARDPGNPFVLDTLAAAYSAAGRHDEAVGTQQQALERLSGKSRQRGDFAKRLDQYRERLRGSSASQ